MDDKPDSNPSMNRRRVLATVGASLTTGIGAVGIASGSSDCGIPEDYGREPGNVYPSWEKPHSDYTVAYNYDRDYAQELRTNLVYWGVDTDNPDGSVEHQFTIASYLIAKRKHFQAPESEFETKPIIGSHTIEIDNKSPSKASIYSTENPYGGRIGATAPEQEVDSPLNLDKHLDKRHFKAVAGLLSLASTTFSVGVSTYSIYAAFLNDGKSESDPTNQTYHWNYQYDHPCEAAYFIDFEMKCAPGEESASLGVTVSGPDWWGSAAEVEYLETVNLTPYF